MQAKALEEAQRKAAEEAQIKAEVEAKVQMLAVSCVCMF